MGIKILCLHGMGTSSDIFETQLSAVASLLPHHYSLEFVDGENECEAASGVEAIYPGPYFCYYSLATYGKIAAAHEYIRQIIAEDGPFDGVMGFSQGGALAASLILRHQAEYPFAPPLFRFAIFICSSLPFSWNDQHGVDVTKLSRSGGTEPQINQSPDNFNATDLHRSWAKAAELTDGRKVGKESGESQTLPMRSFFPDHDTDRIKIPTAHVSGRLDPYLRQSNKLVELCASSLVTRYEHPGGHDIPRGSTVSDNIRAAIEKVVSRGEFIH